MKDFGTKFIGPAIRIAGLIHGVANKNNTHISSDTFKQAIVIAEWLGKHAESIYLDAGTNRDIENAKYILKRIATVNYKNPISKGNLLDLCQRFKTAEEMQRPLDLLTSHEYIKLVKKESGDKGRPRELIYVNPEFEPS